MRLLNTTRNTAFGFIGQLLNMILGFVNRSIFIYFLGITYLGIAGLFSNILSMLSLAELGLGVAIVFNLYKPLMEKETKKIQALMNFYKYSYNLIGGIVLVVGLALLPFLDYLIKEKPDVPDFTIIYLLFLLNSVASYFITYKRSIFSADQKEYVNTINRMVFLLIQNVLQFLVLLLTKNYLLYLLIMVICTVASNISISIKCEKKYPYLKKNKEKLSKIEKKSLMRYVFAQMSHKVGGVVVNGTDVLLISSLVTNGVNIVGIYSNYVLLMSMIKNIINMFFVSVTASVGHLNASNDSQKSKYVFDNMFLLNYFFYGISACCLINLSNDFIKLWIGSDFLLSFPVVCILILNYYLNGMRNTCITYNTTMGLFWNDRFKPWFEAAINLISSLIFIRYYGMAGVFLGTLLSTVTTSLWVEPYILYKHGFKLPLSDYFIKYGKYTVVIIIATFGTKFLTNGIIVSNWALWIVKAAICVIIPIIVLCACFWRTKEFQSVKGIMKSLSKIVRGKNNGN